MISELKLLNLKKECYNEFGTADINYLLEKLPIGDKKIISIVMPLFYEKELQEEVKRFNKQFMC